MDIQLCYVENAKEIDCAEKTNEVRKLLFSAVPSSVSNHRAGG